MLPEYLGVNVSRETLTDLMRYHDLLQKWTTRINLISKSSAEIVWERHIWDSAQLVTFVENADTILDIGSGGGLPGLVLSIFAKHERPQQHITMIESDQRKSAFLRTVVRELDLNADVISERVEHVASRQSAVLTARALADLSQLLVYTEHHLVPDGTAYFLKGENWQKEISAARKSWSFEVQAHTSKTNPTAAVLEIGNLSRV